MTTNLTARASSAFSTVKVAPKGVYRPRMEALEDRTLPAVLSPIALFQPTVSIAANAVPQSTNQPGDKSVLFADFNVSTNVSTLRGLTVATTRGSLPIAGNLSRLNLWADLNRNPRDGCEALLSSSMPLSATDAFFDLGKGFYLPRSTHMQVRADVAAESQDGAIGLYVKSANAMFAGWNLPSSRIGIRNLSTPSMQAIQAAPVDVYVSQKSIGSTFKYVFPGDTNLPVLRFETYATGNASLTASFTTTSAVGGNYSLWGDYSGDGIPDTIVAKGVASHDGHLTFTLPTQAAKAITWELRTDIRSDANAGDELQVNFDSVSASNARTGRPIAGEHLRVFTTYSLKFVVEQDVRLAMTLRGPQQAVAASPMLYTVFLTNTGRQTAANVELRLSTNWGVGLITGLSSYGAYERAPGTIYLSVGNLAPGQTSYLTIALEARLPGMTTVVAQAFVTANGMSEISSSMVFTRLVPQA